MLGAIKKYFALAIVCCAVCAVAQERMTTMLPGSVKNFELPNFDDKTGVKEWDLFGKLATYKSDSQIDVEELRLVLFEGNPPVLKAEISSPLAHVNQMTKVVNGKGALFVKSAGYEIDGRNWKWISKDKFVEVFDGVNVKIIPSRASIGGEKISITNISGKYGSWLDTKEKNIFVVEDSVRLANEEMTLTCQSLTLDADRHVKDADKRVGGANKIVAKKDVRMLYDKKDVSAGLAEIYPKESTAILTQSPRIVDVQSKAEISGAKIILNSQKSSLDAVSNTSQRAKAVIYNDKDGKSEKTEIFADKISMSSKDGISNFSFKGNVQILSEAFKASCAEIVAQSQTTKEGKNEVKFIKGGGKVRLSNENGIATAMNIEISPLREEVQLIGKATLENKERGMHLASHLIVFLKERNTGLAFADVEDKKSFVVLTIRGGIDASGKADSSSKLRTTVKSKRLKFVRTEKNMDFDFKTDVKVESGDIVANCQQMEVLAIREGGNSDTVKKITARDTVKVTQKGYSAEAELAVIYPHLKAKGAASNAKTRRFVELLTSPDNPAKRPTIILPPMGALGIEEARANKKPTARPTIIISDKQWLVGADNAERYFFEGDVKAVGTDMETSCDKIVVSMRPQRKGGKLSISRIEMTGNVKMSSGMKDVTCGVAEIQPEDEMVVLREDPVVVDREDNTRVSGPRMVYNRGKRLMSVETNASPDEPTSVPEVSQQTFIPTLSDDDELSPSDNPRPTIRISPSKIRRNR